MSILFSPLGPSYKKKISVVVYIKLSNDLSGSITNFWSYVYG